MHITIAAPYSTYVHTYVHTYIHTYIHTYRTLCQKIPKRKQKPSAKYAYKIEPETEIAPTKRKPALLHHPLISVHRHT